MFLIVPKPKKPLQAASAPTQGTARHPQQQPDNRGPVRSQTACDVCRLRKSKCNGERPCGSCSRKNVICVYSRTTKRDMPLSDGQAALLQRQQRRLTSALQIMAAKISYYQGDGSKKPEDFDVLQLLDKWGPVDDMDEDDVDTAQLSKESAALPAKRVRDEFSGQTGGGPVKRSREAGTMCLENQPEAGSCTSSVQPPPPPSELPRDMVADEPLFTIEPGPDFFIESNASDPNNTYDAMLQFFQLMNNTFQPSDMGVNLPLEGMPAPIIQPGSNVPTEDHNRWLMNLVDWRASLENFPGHLMDATLAPNGPLPQTVGESSTAMETDTASIDPMFLNGFHRP